MDMKDVYAALEKLDNGADLITAIKGEINTLNNEAKKNRIAGEHTAEKLKNVLAGLDLEDASDDHRRKVLGIQGNKAFKRGADWREYEELGRAPEHGKQDFWASGEKPIPSYRYIHRIACPEAWDALY